MIHLGSRTLDVVHEVVLWRHYVVCDLQDNTINLLAGCSALLPPAQTPVRSFESSSRRGLRQVS